MDRATTPPTAPSGRSTYSLQASQETEEARRLRESVEAQADEALRRRQRAVLASRLALLASLLLLWEFGAGTLFDSFFTSKPTNIGRALYTGFVEGEYLWHAGLTIFEAVSGYLIGASSALFLALLVTTFQRLYDILEPFVMAFYAIPRIALAPLFIMWFGIGVTPKVVIAAIMVFFVVFMNTVAGVRSANVDLVGLSRLMGAHRLDLLRHVVLPSALPYILTALRIVVPTAFIGAIVGEFISSQRGLGFLINQSTFSFNIAGAMSGILVLLVSVLAIGFLLGLVERRLLKWRPTEGE